MKRQRSFGFSGLGSALLAGLLVAGVAACGKVGAPQPPGPPEQITYPKTYPTQ